MTIQRKKKTKKQRPISVSLGNYFHFFFSTITIKTEKYTEMQFQTKQIMFSDADCFHFHSCFWKKWNRFYKLHSVQKLDSYLKFLKWHFTKNGQNFELALWSNKQRGNSFLDKVYLYLWWGYVKSSIKFCTKLINFQRFLKPEKILIIKNTNIAKVWNLRHDGIVPKRNKSETVLSVKGLIPKNLPQSGITPKSNNSER